MSGKPKPKPEPKPEPYEGTTNGPGGTYLEFGNSPGEVVGAKPDTLLGDAAKRKK